MSAGTIEPLQIALGWPAHQLSPNASVHYMALANYKRAARKEAFWSTKLVLTSNWHPASDLIRIHITAHPKPTGPHPDAQNLISSLKAHFDGIADALGVNDRDFDAPTVTWADRCERGKLIVEVA